MAKTAVIYWSGTGNTQEMANAVFEGAKAADADSALFAVSETDAASAATYDVLLLGCPAMGAEVLEEDEFEPFFTELEPKLAGKRSACSALTAGATANGCATGKSASRLPVRSLSAAKDSLSTKAPMTRHWKIAAHSAKPPQHKKGTSTPPIWKKRCAHFYFAVRSDSI